MIECSSGSQAFSKEKSKDQIEYRSNRDSIIETCIPYRV